MTYIQKYYLNQTPNTSAAPNSSQQANPVLLQTLLGAQTPTQAVTLGAAFKPARAGKTKSHIVFLLDDSGSMQSCRDSTISGFNEYLQGQRVDSEATGIETFVSLYKFNGASVTNVINKMSISEVQPLTRDSYNPLGGTNLLDALGGVMMAINSQLKENKKVKRESVIVTVLTDGEENASRSFTNSDIKQMVEKAEAKSWGFMFLGANIDAFAASSKLGFNSSNTIQYDTTHIGSTISAASAMTSRMRSAYSLGATTSAALYDEVGFTDSERSQSTSAE